MEPVTRSDDGELCGYVERRDGRWSALTVFGAVLGEHEHRDDALEQVAGEGLASLADPWTLRRMDTGGEEIVWIREAGSAGVTLARGHHSVPGFPTLTLTVAQLTGGEWELRR